MNFVLKLGKKKMRKYNQYGSKTRQVKDKEDKAIDYKNLIYNERGLYSTDRDLIAYKYANGEAKIVAFLELTRIEKYPDEIPPPGYFQSILNRYKSDSQKAIGDIMSKGCGAPTIIIAMSLNLQNFYLYNLTKDNNIWYRQDVTKHLKWHYKIRDMIPPPDLNDKYFQKNVLEVLYKNG